jgi:precorrin-2 dehydrogenase/sirohydrochlorin ferrochelatase
MRADACGLAITLDLDGARALVVGGDDEAERKIELLLDAGAAVQVLADTLTPRVAEWAATGRLAHAARPFSDGDLDGTRLVLVALRDRELARAVHAAARARGVLAWACDDPEASDLAMPALARAGALRLAVSTSGHSPSLAARLRALFESQLGPPFDRFVETLGALRAHAQREEPDAGRRRALLHQAIEGFSLDIEVRYPTWFK